MQKWVFHVNWSSRLVSAGTYFFTLFVSIFSFATELLSASVEYWGRWEGLLNTRWKLRRNIQRATSQWLNFSKLSCPIRFNLLHPQPSSFLFNRAGAWRPPARFIFYLGFIFFIIFIGKSGPNLHAAKLAAFQIAPRFMFIRKMLLNCWPAENLRLFCSLSSINIPCFRVI